MTDRKAHSGRTRLLLLLFVLMASGCSSATMNAPSEAHPPTAPAAENPREVVRAEKARIKGLQERLQAVEGRSEPASPEAGTEDVRSPSPPAQSGCEQTCDAASALCESTDKICDIADDHPTDAEFADSCTWATQSCDDASSQCSLCGGSVAEDRSH